MAAVMLSNTYSSQAATQYPYMGQPQGPPSPPMDDTSKLSLPSISNLLYLADAGSPTSENSPASQEQQQQQQRQQAQASKPDTRPNSSHYGNVLARNAMPPTPPMSSDASFDGYHSPSTRSVSQLSVTSNYYFESTPPPLGHVEAEAQRPHLAAAGAAVPRIPVQAPAYGPAAAYAATPSFMSQPALASYYPTMQPTPPPQPQISGLYYQRPLPQNFPPLPVAIMGPGGGSNPWQHHHYIAPSTAASFPQSQDRYICQTCNKAFSRPSSLRIHSHSHTGEKPFKCPHPGCGKAFSVRSNMKRHERGCHNFESGASRGSPSPF
ncbi:Transcription factor YY2 [Pleurostoma richardsiae]|uniref:Transcription factor YY2 n=1 Tax=Pleurostoma richardsiae TaxID=41990 RepID=A0AA38RP29_9PEZI|nr:Transcription factor YY2 [Pleurostoma richardsiae]